MFQAYTCFRLVPPPGRDYSPFMDADARTLLKRVEAALEDSRLLLALAAQRRREAEQRVARTRHLVSEDWFVQIHAALLQRRSGRLLWQASPGTGNLADSPLHRKSGRK